MRFCVSMAMTLARVWLRAPAHQTNFNRKCYRVMY